MSDPTPGDLAGMLVEALIAEGAGAGNSLHSWRCEYPDRYGPCTCVEQTASELLRVVADWLRADAQGNAIADALCLGGEPRRLGDVTAVIAALVERTGVEG